MITTYVTRFMGTLCFCVLFSACATRSAAPPSLIGVTRVDVQDNSQHLIRRITATARVTAIIGVIGTQRDWHHPFLTPPVGSFQLTFYSGSKRVAFFDYGPGWLMYGFPNSSYTDLSRDDRDHLLQLLQLPKPRFPESR